MSAESIPASNGIPKKAEKKRGDDMLFFTDILIVFVTRWFVCLFALVRLSLRKPIATFSPLFSRKCYKDLRPGILSLFPALLQRILEGARGHMSLTPISPSGGARRSGRSSVSSFMKTTRIRTLDRRIWVLLNSAARFFVGLADLSFFCLPLC